MLTIKPKSIGTYTILKELKYSLKKHINNHEALNISTFYFFSDTIYSIVLLNLDCFSDRRNTFHINLAFKSLIQRAPISIIPAIVPAARPTISTHIQPLPASHRLHSLPKEVFDRFTINLWRNLSRAKSLCQSIV